MTAFIDSRDGGLLLVSHFSLLLGMAAPVWLSAGFLPPSSCAQGGAGPAPGGWGSTQGCRVADSGAAQCAWQPQRGAPAVAFAGIVALGAGDSAASALGRWCGRLKLLGTQKTVEGTLGGVAASLLTWAGVGLACGCLQGLPSSSLQEGSLGPGGLWDVQRQPLVGWGALAGACVASSLLELSTTQLDNIFLPLHHFAWLAA